MAVTTTAEAVKAIMAPGKDYDGVSNLAPFIRAAGLLVNRLILKAGLVGKAAPADESAEIMAWLAAHAYKQSDQALASKSTDGASGSYQGQTGDMGLKSTKYGQMALMLDSTGLLNGISNNARAGGFWLGTEYRDQRTFEDREGENFSA